MSIREEIDELYPDEEFIFYEGYDSAILGVADKQMVIIYSMARIMRILMKEMSWEDAVEYATFNITGAYLGDKTPHPLLGL